MKEALSHIIYRHARQLPESYWPGTIVSAIKALDIRGAVLLKPARIRRCCC